MSRKRKIKLLGLLLVLTVTVTVTLYFGWDRRQHISEVFTTQRPGEAKITLHTMRTAWESRVEPQSSWPAVADTVFDGAHLYTVTDGNLVCFDKMSGYEVWKARLASSGTSVYGGPNWLPKLVGGLVFAAQVSPAGGATPSHDPYLCCFNKLTGKLLWECEFDTQIASAVAYSESKIMVPLSSGEVECLAISSGALLWRHQISATHYTPGKQYRSSVLEVQADNRACIVRAGSANFLSLDPVTGQILWSKSISGNIRHDEDADNDTVPFTLHNNSLYLVPGSRTVIAWNAATGAVRWRRIILSTKGDATITGIRDSNPIATDDLLLAPYGKSAS